MVGNKCFYYCYKPGINASLWSSNVAVQFLIPTLGMSALITTLG